jgi:hypothetical protein
MSSLIRQQAAPKIAPVTAGQVGPARPSAAGYGVLKAREKELNNQLSDVQERRNELSQEVQQKVGADRAGVEGRVSILDQRLSQIESDLTAVGRELAATAPASIAQPPPQIEWRGYDDGDMVGAGFAGVAVTIALFIPFIVRSFRRRRPVQTPTTQPALGGERIDRMEQAIDTIAVEIERVSENQRFMTRLLTETQLAGTIAAVRGSAEAAKAAAEGSPNAR